MSNNLSYSLRFPERPRLNSFYQRGGRTWRTDLIFPLFESSGPRYRYSWEGGNDPGKITTYTHILACLLNNLVLTKYLISTSILNFVEGVGMVFYIHSIIGFFLSGYVNEMFLALQQVISTELVERVTGLDLKSFKVNIQRFPHPPYVQDSVVTLLQFMFPLFIMLSFSYSAVNTARAIAVEKELQLKVTIWSTVFLIVHWVYNVIFAL